ncbi:MAG: ABC transporter ATP-binding protein [Pseudomonadota bacterium]
MAAAILLDSLTKRYRDKRLRVVEAVKNVSLTVDEGEAFGFVGPNGAGKTSTIKVIMGLNRPDGGRAEIFGIDAGSASARRRIAYVPENLYLYDYLTPLEFLMSGARMHGVAAHGLRQHCMKWLERFDVAHVAKKRVRTFSKGMTQRTALAHAMACSPRLLVLDEPLSGLDPVGRKLVVEVLQEYKAQGGTVFFSSHILHDVERLGDRFGIIHKGVLRIVSSPEELLGNAARLSVLVRTRGETAVEGFTPEGGNRWSRTVARENLWPVLDMARQAGHEVLEVQPQGVSLEEVFMTYIAGLQPGQ